MRILNSLTVPKNVEGLLWDFLTLILLQNIEKIEGRPFGDIKKISGKRSHKT